MSYADIITHSQICPRREDYQLGRLRFFRGIDTLTAMLILAELHDLRRFGSARALMAFLGVGRGTRDPTGGFW